MGQKERILFMEKKNTEKTITQKCRDAGISDTTYYKRREAGMSEEEALSIPVKKPVRYGLKNIKISGDDTVYPGISALCRAYGLPLQTFYNRLRSRKISLLDATPETLKEVVSIPFKKQGDPHEVTGPDGKVYPSESALARAYDIPWGTYKERRKKCSPADAVKAKVIKRPRKNLKGTYDYKGRRFDTVEAMCNYYGVSVELYYSRKARGKDMKERLRPVQKKEKS